MILANAARIGTVVLAAFGTGCTCETIEAVECTGGALPNGSRTIDGIEVTVEGRDVRVAIEDGDIALTAGPGLALASLSEAASRLASARPRALIVLGDLGPDAPALASTLSPLEMPIFVLPGPNDRTATIEALESSDIISLAGARTIRFGSARFAVLPGGETGSPIADGACSFQASDVAQLDPDLPILGVHAPLGSLALGLERVDIGSPALVGRTGIFGGPATAIGLAKQGDSVTAVGPSGLPLEAFVGIAPSIFAARAGIDGTTRAPGLWLIRVDAAPLEVRAVSP